MTEDTAGPSPPQRRNIFDDFSPEEIDEIINDLPGGQTVSPATRRLYQYMLDLRRVPPPRRPTATPTLPGMDDDVLYAPAQLARPMPEVPPEVGWIIRKRDVTGVSGVGFIGCYFVAPDGFTVQRWFGGPPQDQPKFEVYDKPGTAPFKQISGHNGNTVMVRIPLQEDPDDSNDDDDDE